jgi:hypothetical protein
MKRILRAGMLIVCAMVPFYVKAQQSTDPGVFTSIREQPRRGAERIISTGNAEVDDQSVIRIVFNTQKMATPRPLVPGGPAHPVVHVRVDVTAVTGTTRSPISPIPHYVDSAPSISNSAPGTPSETAGTASLVYHERYYDPAINMSVIPNTQFNLAGTGIGSADYIEVTVTNLMTQESLMITLFPQKFGFRTKVSDHHIQVPLRALPVLAINKHVQEQRVESGNGFYRRWVNHDCVRAVLCFIHEVRVKVRIGDERRISKDAEGHLRGVAKAHLVNDHRRCLSKS